MRPDLEQFGASDNGRTDFEGELAVIISKTKRYATRGDAYECVAGYACFNDGALRNWQHHTIQFTPGRNSARPVALARGW